MKRCVEKSWSQGLPCKKFKFDPFNTKHGTVLKKIKNDHTTGSSRMWTYSIDESGTIQYELYNNSNKTTADFIIELC